MPSNDIYGQTFGSGFFYESQEAYDAFDARLTHILNYQGAHSGQVWKNWSDVIMAFDIQNEPFASEASKCFQASAGEWACGRAATMRNVLGGNNPIKIATGGFGGDISHDCTFEAAATTCPQIDIVSVHRYAGPQGSNPGQWAGSYSDWIGRSNGKLVNLEEWGVDTSQYDPSSEFPQNTQDMNGAGLPWIYWQLLPAKKCDVADGDPFGFYVDSGVPYAQQVKNAASADSPQNWNGIIYE